jgi:hypothetical protein
VQFVQGRQQREELAMNLSPSVVISSSGMLTGGASPYYAQYVVKDPNSAIFITGYQDEESPGRRLQQLAEQGEGTLFLYDRKFQVDCEIGTYSLSAHADENELTQFAAQLEPDRVFLVHGDGQARERIRDLLRQRKLNVYLPRLGEMVEYEGTAITGRRQDVPETPTVITPPITSLDELDLRLPLYNAAGELYAANAKKAIRQLLPPETGLRKMAFNKNEQVVNLTWDFPDAAKRLYAAQIDQIEQLLGWGVESNQGVNQGALNTLARNMVDAMIGRASIHLAEGVVEIDVKHIPDDWKELQAAYQEHTGFRLLAKGARQRSAPQEVIQPKSEYQLEINEAYGVLRVELREHGLYKAGLKDGVIVLSFITPELGYRLQDEIQLLSDKVGYPLDVHPHPNQHEIIVLVNDMCREAGIDLVKNPSLLIDQQTVIIEPDTVIPPEDAAQIQNAFFEQTAWNMKIKLAEVE